MKSFLKLLIILALVLLDQATKLAVMNLSSSKQIIPGLLNFTLVKNYGGVFGIAQGYNYVFITLAGLVILGLLLAIIILTYKKEHVSFALYLICAGGIGNFIDRIARGYVVDFIDTPFIATFNIADSVIIIGIFIIIVSEIFKFDKEDKNNGIQN